MTITRDGQQYELVEDQPIDQEMPQYGIKATHRIKVSNGLMNHIALGVSREHCLQGLLDSGFTITV